MKTRALLVLASMFFVACLGRLAVFASDVVGSVGNGDKSAAAEPAGQCLSGDLADAIKNRIAALEERETTMEAREAELAEVEAQIEKRLGELETANATLKANLAEKKSAQNADIARLAAIYEGMKPQSASDIISEMNPDFAAGLLGSMSAESAASVVAAMDPKKAYMVTVLMANQSKAQ